MSKKGLVGELGLVLELNVVPCLVVLHCMLQDHDFEYFYGLGVSEFTLQDEGTDAGRQGMDTLIGELADIGGRTLSSLQTDGELKLNMGASQQL